MDSTAEEPDGGAQLLCDPVRGKAAAGLAKEVKDWMPPRREGRSLSHQGVSQWKSKGRAEALPLGRLPCCGAQVALHRCLILRAGGREFIEQKRIARPG